MARSSSINQPEWDSIDAILLDMDGTLLDLSFDNHFWKKAVPSFYAKEKGISLEQSHDYLKQCYDEFSGTLNWYCTDFWSEKLGIDIILHKSRMANQVNLRPGTLEFLTQLRTMGKHVYLVTNAHPETLRVKLEQTSLQQYFDRLYSSHQFNQPKESSAFWSQLEQDMNTPLSRCLFIDDTESILIKGKQSGVKYIVMVEQPDMTEPARENVSLPSINQLTELFEKRSFNE